MAPALISLLQREPNSALLLGPGIGQGVRKICDREIRRRCAIDDCRNDAGRQKGNGSEQADVPFALGFMFGDLGEGGKAAEPNALLHLRTPMGPQVVSMSAAGMIGIWFSALKSAP